MRKVNLERQISNGRGGRGGDKEAKNDNQDERREGNAEGSIFDELPGATGTPYPRGLKR